MAPPVVGSSLYDLIDLYDPNAPLQSAEWSRVFTAYETDRLRKRWGRIEEWFIAKNLYSGVVLREHGKVDAVFGEEDRLGAEGLRIAQEADALDIDGLRLLPRWGRRLPAGAAYSAINHVLSAAMIAKRDGKPASQVNHVAGARQLQKAKSLLADAVQRWTVGAYLSGMLLGLVLTLGGVGTVAFLQMQVRGADNDSLAAAAVGGAIGALLSVLNRTRNQELKLDTGAGMWMSVVYGIVRILLGTLYGAAAMSLLSSGWLPAKPALTSGNEVLGWGVMGLAAGFSERLTQDLIVQTDRAATGVAGRRNNEESSLAPIGAATPSSDRGDSPLAPPPA